MDRDDLPVSPETKPKESLPVPAEQGPEQGPHGTAGDDPSAAPEENSSDTPEQGPEEDTPKFRGLYRHVRISVRTLDKIIAVLAVLLVACLIFGIAHGGYTVTFDSNGGTDIAAQELEYGDYISEPEPPTREGYTFEGWYSDEDLATPWDFENTIVSESMELYAKWTPTE